MIDSRNSAPLPNNAVSSTLVQSVQFGGLANRKRQDNKLMLRPDTYGTRNWDKCPELKREGLFFEIKDVRKKDGADTFDKRPYFNKKAESLSRNRHIITKRFAGIVIVAFAPVEQVLTAGMAGTSSRIVFQLGAAVRSGLWLRCLQLQG